MQHRSCRPLSRRRRCKQRHACASIDRNFSCVTPAKPGDCISLAKALHLGLGWRRVCLLAQMSPCREKKLASETASLYSLVSGKHPLARSTHDNTAGAPRNRHFRRRAQSRHVLAPRTAHATTLYTYSRTHHRGKRREAQKYRHKSAASIFFPARLARFQGLTTSIPSSRWVRTNRGDMTSHKRQ